MTRIDKWYSSLVLSVNPPYCDHILGGDPKKKYEYRGTSFAGLELPAKIWIYTTLNRLKAPYDGPMQCVKGFFFCHEVKNQARDLGIHSYQIYREPIPQKFLQRFGFIPPRSHLMRSHNKYAALFEFLEKWEAE